jgi:hypothetical protein
LSSRQIRLSSEGSTSAFCSSEPPATKRTIDSATSWETSAQRLRAGHARQPHAVLRDRRHHALHALEVREVILAQRDQDAIVGAGEIEVVSRGFVVLEPPLEVRRGPVLDQVGQFVEKLPGPPAAGIVGLREREDFLELVEDQQRDEGLASGIPQQVAAVVQELPQRLARDRRAGTGPVPRLGRHPVDRLLDLLGGRRRLGGVVDADVDRTEARTPQPGRQPRAQQRSLAEARLAEQHGQQLALHTAGKFRRLVVATVEIRAGLFRIARETQPRVFRVDGRRGADVRLDGSHGRRPCMRSCRRRTNSGDGVPPGSRAMCSDLNLSGTSASCSGVSSMQTGRMNTAPSAMLRDRSTA